MIKLYETGYPPTGGIYLVHDPRTGSTKYDKKSTWILYTWDTHRRETWMPMDRQDLDDLYRSLGSFLLDQHIDGGGDD